MFRKFLVLVLTTLLVSLGISQAKSDEIYVVTFESDDTSYVKVDFGSNVSSVVGGFDSNTSKVLKVVRGNVSWSGTTIVNDSRKTLIKTGSLLAYAKIYSPKAGVKLMLKVENRSNAGQSVEAYSTSPAVLGWGDYTFDFAVPRQGTAGFNAAVPYNMASIFLDYTLSDAEVTTANQSYYVDDLTFPAATPSPVSQAAATATKLTYEDGDTLGALNADLATAEHPQGIFGGGTAVIADAPAGGHGGKALAITKAGAPWTGLNAIVDTTGALRLTAAGKSTFSFNFYSPKGGSPLAVQLFSGGSNVELTTTAPQGWSTQTFDFATHNNWSANTIYDKVVIFPDFQIEVSQPADVYYVDEVAINGATTTEIIVTPPPPPPPADVKPSVTLAAVMTGKNAKVGTVLSVSRGTWTGTAPITYKYNWYRCVNKASTASAAKPTVAAKCTLIPGKTSSIYKLSASDKGKYVRAMVTATNSVGSSYSTTKSTSVKVG